MDGKFDLDFDSLEPAEMRFRWKGKPHIAVEASAAAAAKYRDATANARVVEFDKDGDGKVVGVKDLADCEALLVSLCVFEVVPNATNSVDIDTVRSWPNRVTGQLFEWIRDHSDLGDDTLESLERQVSFLQKRIDRLRRTKLGSLAKNGQSATPASSTTAKS